MYTKAKNSLITRTTENMKRATTRKEQQRQDELPTHVYI